MPAETGLPKLLRLIIAFLLPPAGAFLQVGIGLHFWLSILLTLCFWVPGQIHALWLVATDKR